MKDEIKFKSSFYSKRSKDQEVAEMRAKIGSGEMDFSQLDVFYMDSILRAEQASIIFKYFLEDGDNPEISDFELADKWIKELNYWISTGFAWEPSGSDKPRLLGRRAAIQSILFDLGQLIENSEEDLSSLQMAFRFLKPMVK